MTERTEMAAHLGRLRDALIEAGGITVRLNTADAAPYLDVAADSFPGVGERIKCSRDLNSGWRFVWGWGPVIGDAGDVEGAVAAVSAALRPLCDAPANGGDS